MNKKQMKKKNVYCKNLQLKLVDSLEDDLYSAELDKADHRQMKKKNVHYKMKLKKLEEERQSHAIIFRTLLILC